MDLVQREDLAEALLDVPLYFDCRLAFLRLCWLIVPQVHQHWHVCLFFQWFIKLYLWKYAWVRDELGDAKRCPFPGPSTQELLWVPCLHPPSIPHGRSHRRFELRVVLECDAVLLLYLHQVLHSSGPCLQDAVVELCLAWPIVCCNGCSEMKDIQALLISSPTSLTWCNLDMARFLIPSMAESFCSSLVFFLEGLVEEDAIASFSSSLASRALI